MQVQTRVVSATNKDLESMITQGIFRKDLFFRLGVIKIHLPSLNERKDDIVPIAKYFLHEFNLKFEKKITGILSDAEEALLAYNWTGNVRELKNIIERAVLICKGSKLTVKDLGLQTLYEPEARSHAEGNAVLPPIPETGIDLTLDQESRERYYINEALRLAEGNESRAAKLLNMNHHTFRYRRKKLEKKQ